MKLVLFQPEIPQNTGTLMRLGACLETEVHIIEPCGFVWSDRKLARSGMDYLTRSNVKRHTSWDFFRQESTDRLILLTPHTDVSYIDFEFTQNDALILGQESSGVPDEVSTQIPHHLSIPMHGENRSLNVAIAGAMVLGEALRQTQTFPRRYEEQ